MGKVYTPQPIASETGFKLTLNNNLEDIETALEDALSRSGATPNQMNADIDMNSNDVLNVNRIDAHEYYQDGQPLDFISQLQEAKDYADAQDLVTLASANSYSDTSDASVLSTANAYTDAAVAAAGDISGPVSSQDQEVVLFDGTSGDAIQGSGVFIDANSNIYGHGATIKEIPGTTYTILESDNGKILEFRNSAGCTVTVEGSENPYVSNVQCVLVQWGANPITVVESLGAVVHARDGLLVSGGQYSAMSLYKRSSTDWVLIGAEA